MKRVLMLMLAVMLIASFNLCLAEDFYVDTDGSDLDDGSEATPWATIQGAIDNDAVENGDTIHVGSGTYTENVSVDKSVKIYGEETGRTEVLAADPNSDLFDILADDVGMRYLIIDGEQNPDIAGVYVNNVDNFSILYCEIGGNEYGIYLDDADEAVINNNEIEDNNNGLYLSSSDDSEITNNDFRDNTTGIYLMGSEIDGISANDFDGGDYGIYLHGEEDNYYSQYDATQLEEDNNFDDIQVENVYLNDDDGVGCFVTTLRW